MAVLSLPLSFNNSFWSQDYRKGLETLFRKLEQGVAENDEIVNFVKARADAERHLAAALIQPGPTGPRGTGFDADDGASLLMAFRGLQAESAAQGQAHKSIATELDALVADPFDAWAQGYKDRLRQSKATVLDNWLASYEQAQREVNKLKHTYLDRTRKADEAEDDAKFAPNANGDTYTTSPRLRPVDGRTPPNRTPSVSERIANRLKEIQKRSVGALSTSDEVQRDTIFDDPSSLTDIKLDDGKVDKGKGKAVEVDSPVRVASPPPLSPPLPPAKIVINTAETSHEEPILLAGLAFSRESIAQLLKRASTELNLRPVRFPLLGEYPDCFTGEEFVAWLNEKVPGFGGSLDRAEDAARELTEREGLLRRLGEFGNDFEHADDAFYQFRPKAFQVERKDSDLLSPVVNSEAVKKRASGFVNLVSRALAANANGEPHHLKIRHEAEDADKNYRVGVRKLDRHRLGLEERIEEVLKTLQRWEAERLRAVKTVLLQYQGTLANLPKSFEPSLERSSTLIASYNPDSDLTALIERYRTGPFRPDPQVYESVAHDESDVVFGIDLRKWSAGGWTPLAAGGGDDKQVIPSVVTALLAGLSEAYKKIPEDAEKRKSWIYEVPLPSVHHLREALNAIPPEEAIPAELFEKYDAPVIAGTIKLWALELDPPIALYEGWDELRKLYPTVGAANKAEGDAEEQRIKDLGVTLQRLPRIHLYVLDAIVSHIRQLIQATKVDEDDEIFITKLALSIGRAITRPKVENELSIQDRHPTLLFIDLIKKYDEILPPTIARKKRESERKIPIRKRTAVVDMRMSRSRIPEGADAKRLLAAQHAALSPPKAFSKFTDIPPPPPPAPPATSAKVEPIPPPPPPPPHTEPAQVTPPPPPPPPPVTAEGRPTFKEPSPEVDSDLPPRPTFADPPPEPEDLPRPKFADPPPEPASPPPAGQTSPKAGSNSRPESPSPRPGEEKSSLAKSAASGVRGPRIARGPRAPGGAVSSMVSNINRNSVDSSRSSSPTSPTAKRLSGSPSRRPSSVLGRTSAFSRRTVASDAEDEVLGK